MEQKKKKPDWDKLTKLDVEKLEIARELGLFEKIREGGYRSLTARESGQIGGRLSGKRRKQSRRCVGDVPEI